MRAAKAFENAADLLLAARGQFLKCRRCVIADDRRIHRPGHGATGTDLQLDLNPRQGRPMGGHELVKAR